MTSLTWVLLLIEIGLSVVLIAVLLRHKASGDGLPAAQLLQQQLAEIRDQTAKLTQSLNQGLLDATGSLTRQVENQLHMVRSEIQDRLKDQTGTLQTTQDAVGKRLDAAAVAVRDVNNRLTQLDEGQKRIFEVGKDISSLQEILRAPKLRGGLGELLLGDLLAQILPTAHFQLQKTYADGQKVDAALKVGDRWVPVDAKFPMENFKRILEAPDEAEKKRRRREFSRDVEKHIGDIAAKYIRPAEGTYDFALMYIPAENVYYEIVLRDEEGLSIGQAAIDKKIIPVSPNSFFAYLQVILVGLKGLELEARTREVLDHLQQMHGHLSAFRESFEKLGSQLGHAHQNFEKALRDLDRLDDRLTGLTSIGDTQTRLPMDKPG